MESLGFVAILVLGIILGLMGGGGSILTVPIMVYLFKISPTVSTGYSLFVVGVTVSRALILPIIPRVILIIDGFSLTK